VSKQSTQDPYVTDIAVVSCSNAFPVIRHATEKSQDHFDAVIVVALLVNLLAALNFANVFRIKNVWIIKKTSKNVTQNKNT